MWDGGWASSHGNFPSRLAPSRRAIATPAPTEAGTWDRAGTGLPARHSAILVRAAVLPRVEVGA